MSNGVHILQYRNDVTRGIFIGRNPQTDPTLNDGIIIGNASLPSPLQNVVVAADGCQATTNSFEKM